MRHTYYWVRHSLGLLLGVPSPSNTCRFYPTCSVYCAEALRHHGLVRGGLMCLWRLLRCNPLFKGGWDPV